ncbi:DUF2808 domain-containing protein (plasmid) [Kovacikia minuta CCNUW1]|uniref:DUF2808 domain-containing protein n=1 Tax=Kovacikia minuta TaxID=2931930 RepID=UPI001CCE4D7D|nr:DUF2808 domain-containing protein [Kovacikia minuta]UBF29950.1 DUF2808 domain-containing protein [Kovacikia minuta CCNUW1]
MKGLVFTALYASMMTIGVAMTAQAQLTSSSASAPQIVMADADPLDTQATETGLATHFIDVKVEGNPISQLTIGFPDGLKVARGINVAARSQQSINSTVAINGNTATINFAQPVKPGTTLKVALRGVTGSRANDDIWFYPVSVRYVGETENIPIGTARIQTYDDD